MSSTITMLCILYNMLSISRRKFSTKTMVSESEFVSLTYDLSSCHLTAEGVRSSSSAAGSQLTLSEVG